MIEAVRIYLPCSLAPTCVAYVQFDAQLPMPQQNMEKFKVCEKEMKTKAFSKEGLQQAALAKDEDPNTETKKWYGYLSSHSAPSSCSSSSSSSSSVISLMTKMQWYNKLTRAHSFFSRQDRQVLDEATVTDRRARH